MSRYVASIRKQLQEVSDLFGSRYGAGSSVADLSGKALVCIRLLEYELGREPHQEDHDNQESLESTEEESVIVKAALQGR
jgi:hypothetical protein